MKKILLIVLLNIHGLFLIENAYGLSHTPQKYNLIAELPDIYITSMSEHIGPTWRQGTVWDKALIRTFYSLLKTHADNFTVIDLGAQTGSFTLLAKFFPNSTWYAFEPLAEAATTLKENLILNNINNVSILQLAVTDFCGKAKLKLPTMNEWGLATLASSPLRFNTVMEREIDCIDLDSFTEAHQIQKVDFMKIDTEGSEFAILQGAKKTIMRDHPIILMEYNQTNMAQCGITQDKINNLLQELGYDWKMVSHEDILCIPHRSSKRDSFLYTEIFRTIKKQH